MFSPQFPIYLKQVSRVKGAITGMGMTQSQVSNECLEGVTAALRYRAQGKENS